jgi:dehydrogenase/reductase SDR family protein 7
MSSLAAKLPSPGQSVYLASKSAINGYFNSLRFEVLQRGVKVTFICPGPIEVSGSQVGQKDKRLPTRRYAELIVQASAHNQGFLVGFLVSVVLESICYRLEYK